MTHYLYRAAYERPHTQERCRITFVATPQQALPWAADFVKYMVKGYLLGISEVRSVQLQDELELT